MSAVTGGGNYISDGQIMAWLANQQDRIYGDLRDSMDMSEQRAKTNEDLGTIKAHLHDANACDPPDFNKVRGEIHEFIELHGDDPEYAKICEDLQGISDKIGENTVQNQLKGVASAVNPFAPVKADSETAEAPSSEQVDHAAGVALKPGESLKVSDSQLQAWDDLIQTKIDAGSKNDQLTMIHIQELKATLDQGSQLASTFISSGDKTQSAIINNIA